MHLHHTGSLPVGSPYFAELIQASRTSSVDTIDRLLSRLQGRKDEWVRLSIPERLSLLDEVRKDVYRLKERWVQAELEAKGIQAGTLPEAEEWVILATAFRALRKHRRSLVEIQARGRPQIPGRIVERPDGQVIAPVFPHEVSDRLLFRGVSAEVWMEPGLTAEEVLNTQAAAYRDQDRVGQVAFILGAGNASVLPVTDLLHKLFVELRVAVVKLNPVNAHMGPLMEEGFRTLVERGFLGFVYGGVEEGAYLVNHPAVDELHLTGSDKTYEAVVFGSGPEGVRRKAERQPLVTKRFTGELGNVSPVIVVPGPWQPADIQEQAVQIASWLVANAGFACLTPRVIVQHQSWPGRGRLLDEVGRWLERYPTRHAYYPGALDRHRAYLAAHPAALQYGQAGGGRLPWTILPDVDPRDDSHIAFKHEAFCGLCAETALDAPDVPGFIEAAVAFANHTLWGTLSATLIVHPRSLKDPAIAAAVEGAIARLRYGTVSLNMLAYYSAYFMTAPWGAIPGHDMVDIQSGIGKTFNALMFERPEKSVVKAPFRRLDPITVSSKRAPSFGRRLAEFEAYPVWWKLPGLAITAWLS